jgi:hypothetical protein
MPQESVLLVMPEIAQINQIFHKKVGERNGNGTNLREKWHENGNENGEEESGNFLYWTKSHTNCGLLQLGLKKEISPNAFPIISN